MLATMIRPWTSAGLVVVGGGSRCLGRSEGMDISFLH